MTAPIIHSVYVFDAVANRQITPSQAADALMSQDYFAKSWRVRLACWINRWWYS